MFTSLVCRTVLSLSALALATVVVWSPSAVADTAPANPAEPLTVASDVLPAPQVDGVVWDQAIVGDTVYAVGEFTTARPAGSAPGTNSVARSNMLAYRLSTGQLISGFAPKFNAQVKSVAASPDGARVYVAGMFTSVNGANRYRVAAFTTATGALASFAPISNTTVNVVYPMGSTVYLGGNLSSINNTARSKAAAVRASDGVLLPFAPAIPNGSVQDMVASPDGSKVVMGGSFTSANGSNRPGYGLVMVDVGTGRTNLPLAVNDLIRDGDTNAAILALKSDADGFYGSGYAYSKTQGNLEGSFRAGWDGQLKWVEDCHGDTYDIQPVGGVVYSASHKHYCGNLGTGGFPQTSPTWTFQRATATTKAATGLAKRDPYGYFNFQGRPTPSLLNFYPDINTGTYTGKTQGAWTVEGNSSYVIYGGEFTKVNNKGQQGLVRFAVRDIAPNADGPRLAGSTMNPTAVVASTGAVTLTWKGNWDRDNGTLTYKVLRGSTVVGQVVRTAPFWQIPTLTFTDTGVPPGSTVQYRIQAVDAWGNSVSSDAVAATIPGGGGGGGGGVAVAQDNFNRVVNGGLGSAQTGGAWTVSGGNTSFGVDGTKGSMTLVSAGISRTALLGSVSAQNLEVTADLSMDKAAAGGNTSAAVVARSVNGSNNYREKLVLRPTGDVQVQLTKVVGGIETALVSGTLAGVNHAAGSTYAVRFRVVGTNPTTLSAKAWPKGSGEPSAWTVVGSDSSAPLQVPGGVGFWSYVSGSATNTPQTVMFDNLIALPIQ